MRNLLRRLTFDGRRQVLSPAASQRCVSDERFSVVTVQKTIHSRRATEQLTCTNEPVPAVVSSYFSSGRRRDLCVLLYGTGGLRGQKLKTRLEDHYDTRLDPGTFYSTLDALVESGHLETRTDGIHDVYALTADGQDRLDDHVAWLTREVGRE